MSIFPGGAKLAMDYFTAADFCKWGDLFKYIWYDVAYSYGLFNRINILASNEFSFQID